jgi:hypothetical protein
MRFLVLALTALAPVFRAPPQSVPRTTLAASKDAREWAHPNPDMMAARVAGHLARDASALGHVALLESLRGSTKPGSVDALLLAAASAPEMPADVRAEIGLRVRADASDVVAARSKDTRDMGLISSFTLLGPFRDTGKGLDRMDGPEADLPAYADASKRYDWGTTHVRPREVFGTAAGFAVGTHISPRTETCSLLASTFEADAGALVFHVASAGALRFRVDGTELGRSEETHASGSYDRLAAQVDLNKGSHLLEVKICSGALDDDGIVRVRVTTPAGAPIALQHRAQVSKVLAGLRAAATKLLTPLEACLASQDPWTQALVRTLGGADDQRSPKATGLIQEALKGSGSPSDQTLALAGTISPSAGNRSAYLNRIGKEPTATAYRDRTLIRERMKGQLADWAMSTALGMALDKSTEPNDKLLFAQVNQALRTDALQFRAFQILKELAAAPTEAGLAQIPSDVVANLRELAHGLDRPLARTMQNELYRRGKGRRSHVIFESEMSTHQNAEAAAKSAFAENAYSLEETVMVLRILDQVGGSASLFEEAMLRFPNHAEIASLAAKAWNRQGTPAKRDLALQRAKDLDPASARTKAELKLRTPAAPYRDEASMQSEATILARRLPVDPAHPQTVTVPEGIADRQLHWMRVVTMHPDMRVSQLIHYSREIVIAPRTQEELYEEIPQEGDLTDILKARVHRRNGTTGFPIEEHNDGRRPRIRWPTLSPGDVIEVAVRSWTRSAIGGRGDAPFYFIDYAGAPASHPLLYNEVIVDSPVSHPIHVDVVRGGQFDRTEKLEGDRTVVRLVWNKPPSIPEEPLAPELSETAPLIVGSTYKTWEEFRAWYEGAVAGFTEPDAEVKALAKALTQKESTRDGKIRALFNFVADEIRYVNFVSGEGWLPNRPQQVLTRKEGDCDDKAILLIALLKSIGITAEEVLVQTRMTGMPSLLRAKGAAIPRFDHGIAFLPGPNGGTYLDATSPESRLGPLPSMDARASALPLSKNTAIVTLPRSSPKEHGSLAKWAITLDRDGGGDLRSVEAHKGDTAFWLRTSMRQADAREQIVLDALMGGYFTNVTVAKEIAFDGDLKDGEASVKYAAKSRGGFARLDGSSLIFELRSHASMTSKYAAFPKRTLPVILPPNVAPSTSTHVVTVDAPPGYQLETQAFDLTESGGVFGSVRVTLRRESKTRAVIERTVTFDESEVAVKDYEAFRTWLIKADALMLRGIRFSGGAQ